MLFSHSIDPGRGRPRTGHCKWPTAPVCRVGAMRSRPEAIGRGSQHRDNVGIQGGIFSARWMLSQLLSFEALFVLFLYSNEIKVLLPPLPIDETVLFGALTMAVGAWLLSRAGLYLPGLVIVGTAFVFVAFALISYGWTPSKLLVKQRLAYL